MKFHYQIAENKIEILRCYGTDPKVVIPAQIQGIPVVRIAPYAFSARKDSEEADALIYEAEDSFIAAGEERLLAGTDVEEIVFPDTVEEIGRYVFYGCRNLRSLEFSDSLTQIGSGAFTVCGGLGRLKVHMNKGVQSCVKEILGELWQRIDVELDFGGEKAYFVFPEHYEEAVENTPARILYTQHHGSGNNYRQCFYNRELDCRKYDELFSKAVVMDEIGVLTDLIFGRLEYPYGLTPDREAEYTDYVQAHMNEFVKYIIIDSTQRTDGKKDFALRRLQLISEKGLWQREALEQAVKYAVDSRDAEILGFLMNERQKLFPVRQSERKKNKFVL